MERYRKIPVMNCDGTKYLVNKKWVDLMIPKNEDNIRFDIVLNRSQQKAWIKMCPDGDYKLINRKNNCPYGSNAVLLNALRSMWQLNDLKFKMTVSLNPDKHGRYEIKLI